MAKTFPINGKLYTDQGKTFQEGTFGKIFLVKDEKDEKYILKQTKQQLTTEETTKNIENTKKEVDVLTQLKECPHIIKVVDSLKTDFDVSILLEYGEGGDLFDFINGHTIKSTKITQKVFLSYVIQILKAVECFHNLHIFNLDLKLDNIIFKDIHHTDLAIIDFGFAVESMTGICNFPYGTQGYYNKTERGKEYNCAKADIYSLGVIIYFLHQITHFDSEDFKNSYTQLINKMMSVAKNRIATVKEVREEILKIHAKDKDLDKIKNILQPIFLYYIKEGTTEEDLKGSFQETIENEGIKDDLGDKALSSELKSLILTDTNSILLKSQDGFVILTKNKNTDLNKYTERIVEKNVQTLLDFKFKPKKSSKKKSLKKKSLKKKSLKKKSLKKKSKTKVIKKSRSKKL
jgi:serine/threonine protein kinase